ncbi:MAG: GNAT family N-acetyltransferase [Dehalococcoidia bacterium]|nr:GNAT family N-acetyltransferase [Dehalococcoidia bacterium]
MPIVETPRLNLVSATPGLLLAEMSDHALLGEMLGVQMPSMWPPQYNDLSTMRFMLDLIESDPANLSWGYFYVVLRGSSTSRRLVGGCGLKGKPDTAGMVEIGYSLLAEHQNQGYGTELVGGLVSHAFASSAVSVVVAETLPPLIGSIRVLEKNGFVLVGIGSEPGSIRYERRASAATRRHS